MHSDPITLDCDVLFGTWPARADLDFSETAARQRLARAGIANALACCARGAWFDDVIGNHDTIEVARRTGWLPAGTINLRNALRAVSELDRLVAAGVQAVRLFGPLQGCEPHFPGYLHVVEEAVRRDLVLLVEGDVRQVWQPFAGRGAKVVFLDVHAYHVADFVLLARREPHFVASTRLLNAPDSIERIAGEVGIAHLAFGSRTPLHETAPATLRLRHARLSDEEWAAVAGATLKGLL